MPDDQEKTAQSTNLQPPARRLSRMAVASSVLSLFCMVVVATGMLAPPTDSPVTGAILSVAVVLCMIAAFVGFWLAFISIPDLRRNRQSLRGMPLAVFGLSVPIAFVVLCASVAVWAFRTNFRGELLRGVANSLLVYMQDNSGRYPDPNRWCDLLVANADLSPNSLKHRGQGCYAFNDQATRSSPNDVVLVFESKPGWNQHGGPELLRLDWYWPHGAFVMHKDFSVDYVWPRDAASLRWSPDPNSPIR
jgi:hypothetical protein